MSNWTLKPQLLKNKRVMNSTSITDTISKTVTSRIEEGFSYEGVSGGASQTVTGSESKSMSSTIEEAIERTLSKRTSTSFEFDRGGQFWQFQFEIGSTCSSNDHITIKTKNVLVTNGVYEEPCCLPGAFVDHQYHRSYFEDSPCTCKKEVWNSRSSTAETNNKGGKTDTFTMWDEL